jgi:two-component system, NarL family, response regulator LiaR
MGEILRILVVDDHSLVREGLRLVLSNEPDMDVVGEAANGLEAVKQARLLKPDIILMDLRMPRMNGIEAITEIKKQDGEVRIIVLTSFSDDNEVLPAIQAGARGYLLKDTHPAEILAAIRDLGQNRSTINPLIVEKLIHEIVEQKKQEASAPQLTKREIEVLKLVAQGASNLEIAKKLSVSEHTINAHIGNILKKLHLDNRTQAVLFAIKEGWVDPSASG